MTRARAVFRFDQTLLDDDGWSYEDYDNNIKVWHYDGSEWADVTMWVDGDYFEVSTDYVTSFTLYAVTAVPEPATALLLVCGLTVIIRHRRR